MDVFEKSVHDHAGHQIVAHAVCDEQDGGTGKHCEYDQDVIVNRYSLQEIVFGQRYRSLQYSLYIFLALSLPKTLSSTLIRILPENPGWKLINTNGYSI